MASDWHFNVWRYGLCNTPYAGGLSLAARELEGTPVGPIITNALNGFGQCRAFYLPGEVFADFYDEVAFFRPTPHFPFGFPVEPDLHT